MSCALETLADAVVVELNATDFSGDFTAAKRWIPTYEVADTRTLQVAVAPRKTQYEQIGRGVSRKVLTVDIGLLKLCAAESDISALAALGEEIAEHLQAKRMGSAQWRGTETTPSVDPESWQQSKEFLFVITLTYLQ